MKIEYSIEQSAIHLYEENQLMKSCDFLFKIDFCKSLDRSGPATIFQIGIYIDKISLKTK